MPSASSQQVMDIAGGPIGRFVTVLSERVVAAPAAGLAQMVARAAAPTAPAPVDREGRRTSALTAAGVPVEVSLTGGPAPRPVVRCTVEPGSARPFFGARLQALAVAVEEALDRLGPGAAAGDGAALVPTAYPHVAAVPARTLFAGSVGLVQGVAPDGRPASAPVAVKVYVHVCPDPDALGRVVARWPAFAPLATCPSPAWEAYGVAFEVGPTGAVRPRVYLRSRRPLDAAEIEHAAEWAVPGSRTELRAALADAGAGERTGRRPLFLARDAGAAEASNGAALPATLYVNLSGHRWRGHREAFVRALARRRHGSEALVDAIAHAATAAGVDWLPTMAGLGLTPPGTPGKYNLYACPLVRAREPAAAAASSQPCLP